MMTSLPTTGQDARTAPSVAMVAGEASGDLLGGLLLQALKGLWPDLTVDGVGGPHLAAQGMRQHASSDRLAVRGYVEVLRHYRGIVGIRNALKAHWLKHKPDVFIGVDAPDFNLDLEATLRAAGVPTVHFICPSVWAWRAHRLKTMAQSCDHVLCIFPFEPELLAQHGIAATYVGHPLASHIPMDVDARAAALALGLDPDRPVVAVLPGSRASEIEAIAKTFIQTAAALWAQRPHVQCVLPAAPGMHQRLSQAIEEAGMTGRIMLLQGQSHAALAACDVALVASGTATLETALFKKPMVIAYRMNPVSWWMMKRKRLQPWVGLPNILSGDFVVPEFLQSEARPEFLATAVLNWLDDPAHCARVRARFTQLHHTLQRPTAQIARDVIQKIIAR
jgi:lipid-A-disaccharide synthase